MSGEYTSAVDSLETELVVGRHVQKRMGHIHALDAFAARRVADDLEALILEVNRRSLAGLDQWPNSRGFEVLPEPLADGAEGRVRICLQLLEKRYRDVFRSLCTDVCDVIKSASNEDEAIRFFQRRLLRWQSFLQKHGPDGLDEQARCGLYGELLVFRNLLLPHIEPRAVVQAWRGCKKAHQDFQFPDRALEVKTTRAAIPDRVSVSNVQQLDDEGMEHMFLTLVHVQENETVGETLPEVVDSLRATLPEHLRDAFEVGLDEVGYSDAHSHLYSKTRYQHLENLHFRVCEGFPRLTRDQIPKGIKSVRYELSIDACRRFLVNQAVVLELLKE